MKREAKTEPVLDEKVGQKTGGSLLNVKRRKVVSSEGGGNSGEEKKGAAAAGDASAKVEKSVVVKKEEKRVPDVQVKKEKKKFEKPGQRRETPPKSDPTRMFYESMYIEKTRLGLRSELAQNWVITHGVLEAEEAAKLIAERSNGVKHEPILDKKPTSTATGPKNPTKTPTDSKKPKQQQPRQGKPQLSPKIKSKHATSKNSKKTAVTRTRKAVPA